MSVQFPFSGASDGYPRLRVIRSPKLLQTSTHARRLMNASLPGSHRSLLGRLGSLFGIVAMVLAICGAVTAAEFTPAKYDLSGLPPYKPEQMALRGGGVFRTAPGAAGWRRAV